MISTETPSLNIDHVALRNRASSRGTSFEAEHAEFLQRETGGTRPDAIAKLDQRQTKLEADLRRIEEERAQQLGIAAKFHSLTVEVDRLRTQLETAKGKRDLHLTAAAEALLNAKLRLVVSGEAWQIAGSLLAFHLEQNAVASAMGPLIDELSAQVATAEEAVLAYGREHGIASPSKSA